MVWLFAFAALGLSIFTFMKLSNVTFSLEEVTRKAENLQKELERNKEELQKDVQALKEFKE